MNKKQFDNWYEQKKEADRRVEEIKNAHQIRFDRLYHSHSTDKIDDFLTPLLFATMCYFIGIVVGMGCV